MQRSHKSEALDKYYELFVGPVIQDLTKKAQAWDELAQFQESSAEFFRVIHVLASFVEKFEKLNDASKEKWWNVREHFFKDCTGWLSRDVNQDANGRKWGSYSKSKFMDLFREYILTLQMCFAEEKTNLDRESQQRVLPLSPIGQAIDRVAREISVELSQIARLWRNSQSEIELRASFEDLRAILQGKVTRFNKNYLEEGFEYFNYELTAMIDYISFNIDRPAYKNEVFATDVDFRRRIVSTTDRLVCSLDIAAAQMITKRDIEYQRDIAQAKREQPDNSRRSDAAPASFLNRPLSPGRK